MLDVGCGPGRDGLIFKLHGFETLCLDASPAMLRRCVQKGLSAVRADLHAIPLPDGSVDGAWAYCSLLHCPKKDMDHALIEIRRVLAAGGVCGIGLYEGTGEGYKDPGNTGNVRWFSYFEADEVRELLERNGFEIFHEERIKPSSRHVLHFIARKI